MKVGAVIKGVFESRDMSCTAHDTGLSVFDRAGQSCFLVLLLLLGRLLSTSLFLLVLDLLYHCLVHGELDGVGGRASSKVVHTSLQALLEYV